MRHRKKGRKLSRTASHRTALRRNLASALLRRERVITTPAKAKEIRPFVERLITLARRAQAHKDRSDPGERAAYVHYYRLVLQRLQDREMVQKLFGEGKWRDEEQSLAERYLHRPGGYTRIVRLGGSRLGMPVGGTVGEIPELTYEIGGRERTLRLTGNRLGDNAPQVIFELVEEGGEMPEGEVAPAVELSEPAAQDAEDGDGTDQPEGVSAEETAE
jgi:large subunit ribosomal protein L17